MEPALTIVKSIFDALNTNPNAFALAHGFNVPTMYGFAEGNTNPGYKTLVKMCAAEPRISAEYLLRGEGEPLRDAQRLTALSTVEELKAFRNEFLQSLDKRIQELEG